MRYTDAQLYQLRKTALLLFGLTAIIAMLFGLAGCETFKSSAVNDCVLDAAEYQECAKAQDGHPMLWSRILFVDDGYRRHAYLIYKTKAGNFYAYDSRGSRRLWKVKTQKQSENARYVAELINPNIGYAAYETIGTE